MIHAIVGCDYRARHPEVGARIQAYYQSRDDIALLACCRKDLSAVQQGDTVVAGCTLCDIMLAERVPFAQRKSIYELALEDATFAWPDYEGREMCLQDCWRARNNRRVQDAVRACLERMHVHYLEMPERREHTTFCGTWLNNPPAPDCVELAPKAFAKLEESRELLPAEEQEARMRVWCERYATDEVVIYCNGCERGVALGGKQPIHLLELMFPVQ